MPCLTLPFFRPSSLFAFHFLSILFSYPPPFSFLTFLVSFPLFSPPLSLSLPFSFVSSYILSFFPCHLIPFRFHAFSFRGRNEVSVACYRFYIGDRRRLGVVVVIITLQSTCLIFRFRRRVCLSLGAAIRRAVRLSLVRSLNARFLVTTFPIPSANSKRRPSTVALLLRRAECGKFAIL